MLPPFRLVQGKKFALAENDFLERRKKNFFEQKLFGFFPTTLGTDSLILTIFENADYLQPVKLFGDARDVYSHFLLLPL